MAKTEITTIIRPTDEAFDERFNKRMRQRSAVIAASACKVYNLTAIRKRLEDCLKKLPAKKQEGNPC